jgi:hypothetical protein
MQSVPDAGGLPVPKTATAAYAAAAAHLARLQVPAQARLQDEQDSREHRTIIERLRSRVARTASFGRGQQRCDELPQLVIKYRFGHILFVTETMMRLMGWSLPPAQRVYAAGNFLGGSLPCKTSR